MNKELEIKIEVSLDIFIKLEKEISTKGEKLAEKTQEDIYYSPSDESFYDHGDKCLRIRKEEKEIYLSYKQIYHERLNDRFIDEYETKIGDFDSMDQILSALKFRRDIVVKKHRKEFAYGDKFLIALDEVEGLGHFIEIENKNEGKSIEQRNKELVQLAISLGLDLSMQNEEGYSNMLYKRSKK